LTTTAARLAADRSAVASRSGLHACIVVVRNRQAIRLRSIVVSLVLLVAAAGCIPVPKDHLFQMDFMSIEELREYSEEVFRHQNRITTRIMMASLDAPSISEDDQRRIDRAESRMNEACASLNEIAAVRAQGEEVGRELQNTVRKTVRSCAQETKRTQRLLDALDVGTG